MGLWRRIATLFGAKANAALDRFEDPRETLEVAYGKEVAALQEARRGVADVLTSEKRLELEAAALQAAVERATATARDAARAGDDAGAARALGREAFAEVQRERMLEEAAAVRAQRLALEAMTDRLQQRVERFRTEKLALGARYTVAKATARAGESVAGLSDDTAEIARIVERARDASRDAQARAAALVELSGTNDVSTSVRSDDARVQARLAALKAEVRPQLHE
ncbi:MAG: PspA/IM30 family protein [Candidatus Eremiobacteraeota bacterium]|nr:PspA/IM30 family protein [Candidatus Eremiobacteraeota bacterium]